MKSLADPLQYFQLKPVKAAKVSEISEATAAAPVEDGDRINFHIGHPIQETSLHQTYFRMVSDLASPAEFDSKEDSHPSPGKHKKALELLHQSIEHCVPYLPRGGFSRKQPGELPGLLKSLLSSDQREILKYNFGDEGGKRECIFSSGGLKESLRILLTAVARFSTQRPVTVFTLGLRLDPHLYNFETLIFENLDRDESDAFNQLNRHLDTKPDTPNYLLIGKPLSENARRRLRLLSLSYPLYFIEMNDAPNHLSLAREAKMLNRVTRILTPAFFAAGLGGIAVNIVLGNAELLNIFELVHFELKGTPSAAEVDYLGYKLKQKESGNSTGEILFPNDTESVDPDAVGLPSASLKKIRSAADRWNEIANNHATSLANVTNTYAGYSEKYLELLQNHPSMPAVIEDSFAGYTKSELIEEVLENLHQVELQAELEQNFLNRFLHHHPYYALKHSFVVSGSARTAMSLLGFHCGIGNVVIPDLSWTYEHCFPRVETVALDNDLGLDVDALTQHVQRRMEENPHWRKQSAVVLNSPHNASGQRFDEEALKRVIRWLFARQIRIIDDLSYQNLAPSSQPVRIKTLKQVVNELVKSGYIESSAKQLLITVHSLSKTDCFAGARMAVVEINEPDLHNAFSECLKTVQPNSMALFQAYLFYRNEPEEVENFWKLRNRYLDERMKALEDALHELPMERNPYRIDIRRPAASMYPQMIINNLPDGISLDWLASNLAKRGIGLIPLSTFARTAEGFDLARKTFRMTLGGKDDAATLRLKTRRVLIDLNRLIADEQARYTRRRFTVKTENRRMNAFLESGELLWKDARERLAALSEKEVHNKLGKGSGMPEHSTLAEQFRTDFLPEKLALLDQRFKDRMLLNKNILHQAASSPGKVTEILEQEFYKEQVAQRQKRFRTRLFDRTVHPTQMYALETDEHSELILENVFDGTPASNQQLRQLSDALIKEYLGSNIAINSIEEANELVLDLSSIIRAEEYARWFGSTEQPAFLSFWGDWDGSTRPSGQGHRLVAAALLKNVSMMTDVIRILATHDSGLEIPSEIIREIDRLETAKAAFWKLSNKITNLTNQLEKRYRSVMPFQSETSRLRKLGIRLHLVRDPLTALWQHNDRLEKRMIELRLKRRQDLEYYFSLNKQLRKFLYSQLPRIEKLLSVPEVALKAGSFRNYLRRFILTPRIHQKMILSDDAFGIDTTVHNMLEINQISAAYGNPGMVLALQVSMSTEPEALITLDSKIRARKDLLQRENPDTILPNMWLVPLFEDTDTIENLTHYLDRIWTYAIQSRRVDQQASERFSDMICELFIAGSDISQQVGQARGASLYKEAKHNAMRWLAERGLVEKVRMKLGSGEPMQRQGGYYEALSGAKPFLFSSHNTERYQQIKPSIQKSTEYARIPLMGILATGDLRTLQSTVFEKLRHLPVAEFAQLLYHLKEAQKYHDRELIRASEPLLETRLIFRERGYQELELLTAGKSDPIYSEFLQLATSNFRQILYGLESDVVGIHVISYFISRALPVLRDRPTVRPSRDASEQRGQKIIARIAQTLPMATHGSLLRAIGHNRSQTMILGISQLTTGLFRALDDYSNRQTSYSDRFSLINDRILPNLPVKEILQSLRLYFDLDQTYLKRLERAFPAGNSCFTVLREDIDAIYTFIGYVQRELVRRLGVEPSEFFRNGRLNPVLLPMLHPELAVLLQPQLFNTDAEKLFTQIGGPIDQEWRIRMEELLGKPVQVRKFRDALWDVIEENVFSQVKSFVELAGAINALSSGAGQTDLPFPVEATKVLRLGSQVNDLLRGIMDDSMRQFLSAAVQYLIQVPGSMSEVPIDIIRALRDVEQIIRIEEQAFSASQQNLIRFYVTQMARLCGENG